MQAAVIHRVGPAVGEFPDPPADGSFAEVVAPLNPVDVAIAAGKIPFRQAEPPFVAGLEGVARLDDGSHRYFSAPATPYGSFAELVPLAGAETARVPADLDPVTAAALGWSVMGAGLSLTGTGGPGGESVLIIAASGQVGRIAVQVARLLGASRVVAVVNDDAERQGALDRGADAAVSSAEADGLAERVRTAAPDGVDLIQAAGAYPAWMLWGSYLMSESVEANCLDCPAVVTFDNQPGSTTCTACGARLSVTSSGQLGAFPA